MASRPLHGRLCAAVLLAGCNSAPSADPAPEITDTTASFSTTADNSQPAPSSVPQVAEPIDPGYWENNPCEVLTSTQQNKLTIDTTPQPETTSTQSRCTWGSLSDDQITISVALGDEKSGSVQGWYENNELGRYDYFDPITINGYPGVFADMTDARDHGVCGSYIALQDDYTYSLGATLYDDYPGYDE